MGGARGLVPVHEDECSCLPIRQHAEAVVATLRTGLVPSRSYASLVRLLCCPFRAEGQHLLCVPITAYHAFECPDDDEEEGIDGGSCEELDVGSDEVDADIFHWEIGEIE